MADEYHENNYIFFLLSSLGSLPSSPLCAPSLDYFCTLRLSPFSLWSHRHYLPFHFPRRLGNFSLVSWKFFHPVFGKKISLRPSSRRPFCLSPRTMHSCNSESLLEMQRNVERRQMQSFKRARAEKKRAEEEARINKMKLKETRERRRKEFQASGN